MNVLFHHGPKKQKTAEYYDPSNSQPSAYSHDLSTGTNHPDQMLISTGIHHLGTQDVQANQVYHHFDSFQPTMFSHHPNVPSGIHDMVYTKGTPNLETPSTMLGNVPEANFIVNSIINNSQNNLVSGYPYPTWNTLPDQYDWNAESNLLLPADDQIQAQADPTTQEYTQLHYHKNHPIQHYTQLQYQNNDERGLETLGSEDPYHIYKTLLGELEKSDSDLILPQQQYSQLQGCSNNQDYPCSKNQNKDNFNWETLGLEYPHLPWTTMLDRPEWKENSDLHSPEENYIKLQDHLIHQENPEFLDHFKSECE
jgi:hypothetical protein